MSDPTETPAAATPPKSGSKKTMLIVVAGVAIAALAGGGFWWTRMTRLRAASAEAAAPKPASRGLVKFEPFVVNLADGGTHFLRTTLQIVVEPEERAKKIAENPVLMLQLRSAVLELLAQQSASALVTPEGKAAMKAAIISRAQDALDGGKIADVLFSEFVVQF